MEVRLAIHVVPNARVTEAAGRHGAAFKIKVAAPPRDGAANAELVRFLAERLGVAKSAVRLVHGASSRAKLFAVNAEGLGPRFLTAEGVVDPARLSAVFD